jgi:hypothetical protein
VLNIVPSDGYHRFLGSTIGSKQEEGCCRHPICTRGINDSRPRTGTNAPKFDAGAAAAGAAYEEMNRSQAESEVGTAPLFAAPSQFESRGSVDYAS